LPSIVRFGNVFAFFKTIRFRIMLWYLFSLALLLVVLVVGLNAAMNRPRTESQPPTFIVIQPPPNSNQPFSVSVPPNDWHSALESERTKYNHDLLLFSLIGAGSIIILGSLGGYILSGRMLRPIDRISSLASRISSTNLKERISHSGPNDELKRLADTFDGMLKRLDSAFEMQQQFIQDASHELRTPLAIAQTNIEVMEMAQPVTMTDYQRLLAILKLSLERMNRVSNSLLMLSEGTPVATEYAGTDIAPLLEEIFAETRAGAYAAGVELDLACVPDDLVVRGDAFHLKQAVINLVDNAVKYNRRGGRVDISAGARDGQVVISVRDTGIGIPPEHLPHIFDRFYRVDKSRSREKGGSGLGLAIVKKIAEDHGGTATVESITGEGSTFRLILPALG
jgi:signal transduction histidine kinase